MLSLRDLSNKQITKQNKHLKKHVVAERLKQQTDNQLTQKLNNTKTTINVVAERLKQRLDNIIKQKATKTKLHVAERLKQQIYNKIRHNLKTKQTHNKSKCCR